MRIVTSLGAGVLLLLWAASLLLVLRSPAATDGSAGEPGLTMLAPAQPSWRDTLVLQLALGSPGVEQRRGFLTWIEGQGRPHQLSFAVTADGHSHRVVLPIGAHPGWRGDVHELGLLFGEGVTSTVAVLDAQLLTRPPWALDALLLRWFAPLLPEFPPWEHSVLLTAVGLGAVLALAWPYGRWRRRLAVLGIIVGSGATLITILGYTSLLLRLIPVYTGLDTMGAALRVASYTEASEVNAQLVRAAAVLPEGPVLARAYSENTYPIVRSRYLLYPRRVDVLDPRVGPEATQQQLVAGYVALIGDAAEPQPLPGWQRLDDQGGPLSLWYDPAAAPPPTPRPVGAWAPVRLVLALLVVYLAGWALSSTCGLRGVLRAAAAWPYGVTLLAWWMVAADLLDLPWIWWSIALPLLALAGIIVYRRRTMTVRAPVCPASFTSWRWWEYGALAILTALVAGASAHAVLVPVNDQDSWTMWALKGQAFFRDGAMAPVLTMYSQSDLHHSSYPPAQPLVQAWAYSAMGGIDERLARLVFTLWYASCLGLVWAACKRWQGRESAWSWTLLLAATPLLLDHAALSNADLPLAVAWLLGCIALAHWIETGERGWLAGAILALAGGAWLKVDGMFFGLLLLGAAVVMRIVQVRRQGHSGLSPLTTGLVALLLLLASIIPWLVYTQALGLLGATPGLARAQQDGWRNLGQGGRVLVAEMLLSYNNSAWGLMGGGFGALWLIVGGAWLAGWRRLSADPVLGFLVLAVLGGVLCYLGIYVLRPFFSIERYLLHLAPIAVVGAAVALRPHIPKSMFAAQ